MMEWKAAACILSVCLIVVIGFVLYAHIRRKKELEMVISYLMRQQDGTELPKLEKFGEGQIGILQNEIYKMVIRLSSQWDMAKSEKKYLSDMLSDISHQIKTPLAAITIMTDLLKNSDLEPEKRLEFISNIDRETERITWLIKNLLVLSQLEAGVLKLKKERISVKELLERVLGPFEVMAEVKEVSLLLEVPGGQADNHSMTVMKEVTGAFVGGREESVLLPLTCDIHWTTEALSNIVKNCLEHTNQGGYVKLSVSQNNFSTNIRIQDNGAGISPEDLPHIFERFYKASNASTSSVGIGLAMSKQIFLLQGASVSVSSEEGKGTEFLIKFYPVNEFCMDAMFWEQKEG